MNPTFLLFLLFFSINNFGLTLPDAKVYFAEKQIDRVLPHSVKEKEDIIPWSAERRLNWEDFLSPPQRNTDAVASTSTSLGLAYQVKNYKLNYQITCNFSKSKSWGAKKTPYILAHEQGHFDITELYARKLHKALLEYKFNRNTFKSDLDTIYQTLAKQKEAFQNGYDEETDHSRKKAIQMQWLVTIRTLLEETKEYSAYP